MLLSCQEQYKHPTILLHIGTLDAFSNSCLPSVGLQPESALHSAACIPLQLECTSILQSTRNSTPMHGKIIHGIRLTAAAEGILHLSARITKHFSSSCINAYVHRVSIPSHPITNSQNHSKSDDVEAHPVALMKKAASAVKPCVSGGLFQQAASLGYEMRNVEMGSLTCEGVL